MAFAAKLTETFKKVKDSCIHAAQVYGAAQAGDKELLDQLTKKDKPAAKKEEPGV
jgi:hypothetical protein